MLTPFDDLDQYLALPRLTGLRLAPDGTWLAVSMSALSPDRRTFKPSIWRLDTAPGPGGPRPAIRLTRSAEGEDSPAFLPDGGLLFLSSRPAPPGAAPPGAGAPGAGAPAPGTGPARSAVPGGPAAPADAPGKRALWLLPAAGGEPYLLRSAPGGISRLATACAAPVAAFTAPVLPGAAGQAEDADRRKARADAGVTAILHSEPLVRYWDHDLGPDELRLLVTATEDGAEAEQPRDLTREPGRALDEHSFELTPDGRHAVTGWSVADHRGDLRKEVVVLDTATGARRVLLSAPGTDFSAPRVSPDGTRVLAIAERHETYHEPAEVTVMVVPLDGGDPADLLPGCDRWPEEAAWSADGTSVFVTAADRGRGPVFRAAVPGAPAGDAGQAGDAGPAGLAEAGLTRLTTDDGAYSWLCPAPDGRSVYALRSAVDSPPAVVRIDAARPGPPQRLPGLAAAPALPGRLTEIEAAAADGTPVRGWLVLPAAASPDQPAPLLLWVHGGPYSSWNSWSWRWNPWLMAARGYAVLLPDPGLSTGYGQKFIARGHGAWGDLPYTDLMTVTDAAVARADIDAARTAAMGGSFGGYMANWIAGHTTRFRAIVSHASLWALDQMFGTTDLPAAWRRVLGYPGEQPDRYTANSPHRHAAAISTPMLVIHGDKDYRVPVGEALRLWSDLAARPAPLAGARFLYFPDENHWVLSPGNVRVWYQTVYAFLAQHVLGEPWQPPDLL